MIKVRIFIAIDFDKNTKSYFQDIKNKLDNHSIKGRFTHMDNFHLTLQFIGELEQHSIPRLLSTIQGCISKHDALDCLIPSKSLEDISIKS